MYLFLKAWPTPAEADPGFEVTGGASFRQGI